MEEDEMNFILATTNQGKAKEIQALFGENHTVRTLSAVGFEDEIIEDGETFAENAIIKVTAVLSWLRHTPNKDIDVVLADDSGLVIDALDGKPGVYSARWLGVDTSYDIKNQKTLEMLVSVPEENRTARFICVIACATVNPGVERLLQDDCERRIQTVEGILEGHIAFEPVGENGFGYDPIFFVSDKGCTLAQLSSEEKNCISHRAQALGKMCKLLGVDLV